MRNFSKTILVLSFFIIFSSCCTSNLEFQSEVISMNKQQSDFPLKQGKPVGATFCENEKPVVDKESVEVGIFDQVIYKAQQKAKADYLMNVKIYRKCSCVELKGFAASAK